MEEGPPSPTHHPEHPDGTFDRNISALAETVVKVGPSITNVEACE